MCDSGGEGGGGGVPMLYVDYKEGQCHPVEFKKSSCRHVHFKKAMSPVTIFLKPLLHVARPEKGMCRRVDFRGSQPL